MINYDKYYFCKNKPENWWSNKIVHFNQTDYVIDENSVGSRDKKLFNYTMNVCDKLGMKVLKTLAVSSVYKDRYDFYNLNEMMTHSGTFPKETAVALTYNGLINAVVWVDDYEGVESYFYTTNREMLRVGNRFVMRAKDLKPMIKKILDKGQPVSDYNIICSSGISSSGSYDTESLYRRIAKSVSNEQAIKFDYKQISMSGKDLEALIDIAMSNNTRTLSNYDNSIVQTIQNSATKFEILNDKLKNSEEIIKDTLSTPMYMLLTNYVFDDNECVVVKCIPEDNKRFKIDNIYYCSDIDDYRENELVLGVINGYKIKNEGSIRSNADSLMRLNNTIEVNGYSSDIVYDEDIRVGKMTCNFRRRTTEMACRFTGLFLLDMQ